MERRAEVPFEFSGCVELRQLLGLRATNEQELADLLDQVPADSVYYHTHGFLLRHRYMAGAYSNDFATWAAVQVGDRILGEQLAVLDPFDFQHLDDLRDQIVAVIDAHLRAMTVVPRVVYGEPFDFIQSRVVPVPLGARAHTLEQFRTLVGQVDVSAIYYHHVEARVRLPQRRNDFAAWLEEALELPGLAAAVRALDPYIGGLERVRALIVRSCDEVLALGRDL
jgi:hypothetical protein